MEAKNGRLYRSYRYIWDIVEIGYELPKILIDGIVQPMVNSFWIEEERKKHLLASLNEYERILNCITTKKVWDTLKVTHIGTTKVEASKIHVLVSQCEMLKMEKRESIKDFVQRFTILTNHLILLGKTFDNADLIHKVLRLLTKD